MLRLENGWEVWIGVYDPTLIEGLAGDLADGESFTHPDGSTVTRHGDEALWTGPPTR